MKKLNESAAEKNEINDRKKGKHSACARNIIYLETVFPRNLAPLLYRFNYP